jgi:hypothetical protein
MIKCNNVLARESRKRETESRGGGGGGGGGGKQPEIPLNS